MLGSEASRLGYFRNGSQWLVLDLQYSTFRYKPPLKQFLAAEIAFRTVFSSRISFQNCFQQEKQFSTTEIVFRTVFKNDFHSKNSVFS